MTISLGNFYIEYESGKFTSTGQFPWGGTALNINPPPDPKIEMGRVEVFYKIGGEYISNGINTTAFQIVSNIPQPTTVSIGDYDAPTTEFNYNNLTEIRIRVSYLDKSGNIKSTEELIEHIRGKDTSDPTVSAEITDIPSKIGDTLTFSIFESDTDTQGNVILLGPSYKPCTYVAASPGAGGWISLDELARQGLVVIIANEATYNSVEGVRHRVSFRPKIAGVWAVSINYYYRAPGGIVRSASRYVDNIVVKDNPRPVLEITSVVPDMPIWNNPDNNPLDGAAPFTVTITETTNTTFQTPADYAIIDFGDSDSADNVVRVQLSASEQTIPTMTHIFSDTKPHKITLTKFAGADGYSSEIYFTPTQTAHMVWGNVFSQTNAPSIHTGKIWIGGNPLPRVVWEYKLTSDADGYYQGEREGSEVIFVLLAPGDYQMHARVIDAQSGADVYCWNLPTHIAGGEPPENTPQPANGFDVWVYDGADRVDLIQPTHIQFTEKYAEPSYVEFRAPITYTHANLLQPGGILAVGYLGKAVLCVVDSFTEDEQAQYITISATDAASVAMQSRVATVATNVAGGGYDTQICSGEALLRYFAISNTRTEGREIANMRVVGTNQDRGGKCVYSARFEDILTVVQDICADSGLGYRSTLQSASAPEFSFEVIEGVDRTTSTENPVFFTNAENSIHSARIGTYHGFTSPTVAITADGGTGIDREYFAFDEMGASTGLPTGLNRREVFVDASEATSSEETVRMAKLELAKLKEQSITIYPNESVYKLGVDYNVGDIVTVRTNSGIILDVQINSAYVSKDSTGEHISLECGNDLRGYRRMIRDVKLANTYARR